MDDYGRRIVVSLPFETVVGETCRALRAEGFQVIGRVDVRDHFWRDLDRNFRQYVLLQAWSPELALETLERDLDAGAAVATVVAIYELDPERAAIVTQGPFAPLVGDYEWRRERPDLAAIADRESEAVGRALARVQDAPLHGASASDSACARRA
jgi:uncharacterized protein (DUF302 family)